MAGPGDDDGAPSTETGDDDAHAGDDEVRDSTSDDARNTEQVETERRPESSTPRGGRGDEPVRGRMTEREWIREEGPIRWFLRTDHGAVVTIRDVLSSAAIVGVIALLLFAVSGIWPPLVAVESGSMEPHMYKGDLIFVVDETRFSDGAAVAGTGVVTYEVGQETGHESFGEPGTVIVFKPDGRDDQTPIIHRAHLWVEEEENWVDTRAREEWVNGRSCTRPNNCPAPHDGFVTMGDNNRAYDQTGGGATTTVVKPEWVTGKAMLRIPWLGHIRLAFDELPLLLPGEWLYLEIAFGAYGGVVLVRNGPRLRE